MHKLLFFCARPITHAQSMGMKSIFCTINVICCAQNTRCARWLSMFHNHKSRRLKGVKALQSKTNDSKTRSVFFLIVNRHRVFYLRDQWRRCLFLGIEADIYRVEPAGAPVSNNDVRGSDLCVISINIDPRTGRMIVVSHIDNLMKGQAGSALQNMNIMFGLGEDMGLQRPAYYP